jgi:hypothetical protein
MSLLIHRHKAYKDVGAVKKTAPVPKPVAEKPTTVSDETQEDVVEAKTYSKTEINRSSTDRLKEIANEVGIEDADNKTGGELKKLLIGQLGL